MIQSPMLFCANVYALGGLRATQVPCTRQDRLLRLECYTRALSLAAEEIDKMSKEEALPSEDLITTVLILAAYNVDPGSSLEATPKLRLKSSAENSSAVDARFFDLTTSNYHHSSGLHTLVANKGGIDCVHTRGISKLICL